MLFIFKMEDLKGVMFYASLFVRILVWMYQVGNIDISTRSMIKLVLHLNSSNTRVCFSGSVSFYCRMTLSQEREIRVNVLIYRGL